jgi:two-component system, cell cycle response regulator DivK
MDDMPKMILIVDDNQDNRDLVRKILKNSGYQLHEACDGQTAVDMAQRLRPDLILMDIQLPVLDGYQAVARIRQLPEICRVPIIGLTSYAMKGDEDKVLQSGCDAYLAKPIDIARFREMIKHFLEEPHA